MVSDWTNESRAKPDNIVVADIESNNINISADSDSDPGLITDIEKVENVET